VDEVFAQDVYGIVAAFKTCFMPKVGYGYSRYFFLALSDVDASASDGCLREAREELGLTPIAKVRSMAVAGCWSSGFMGVWAGDSSDEESTVKRAGLTIDDHSIVERPKTKASQRIYSSVGKT